MQRKLPNGDRSIDGPFHRRGSPSTTGNSACVTRRYPPDLTGDPHTNWVLWELSLTLADIARNVQTRPKLQFTRQEEAECDCR